MHFKFLNDVRAGKRRVREFADVVVCSANALDQIVVIVFALAIHVDGDGTAAELLGVVQRTGGAGGQGQQLLEISSCQRQAIDLLVLNGLARRGILRVYRDDLTGDLDLLRLSGRPEGHTERGGLGDPNFYPLTARSAESLRAHDDSVTARRKQCRPETSARAGNQAPDGFSHSVVKNFYVCAWNDGASGIQYLARDCPCGPTLSQSDVRSG